MQTPFQTIEQAHSFALAGNAILTLQSTKTGTHFTFKVVKADAEKSALKGYSNDGDTYFVKILTEGSADEGTFTYLGMIKGGQFRLTRASRVTMDSPCVKAFSWFWGLGTLPETLVIRHEGRCGRCGRTLTEPVSIDSGYGPECRQMLGIEIAA